MKPHQSSQFDWTVTALGAYGGTGNRGISFLGKAMTLSSYLGAQLTAVTPNGADRGFIFNTNEIFSTVLNGDGPHNICIFRTKLMAKL